MYDIIWTSKFKRDYKAAIKRNLDITLLDDVIRALSAGKQLAPELCDHKLSGTWDGYRERHIAPDWLLIYKLENKSLVLVLSRTGSHSDLFGK